MTITLNVLPILVIVAYMIIGMAFAYKLAISPIAIVTLVIRWPIFLILMLFAPIINYFVNRNL